MADADGLYPGLLRPCPFADDGLATLDPDVARLHHRLRIELATRLQASVPAGWDVSAGCCWHPEPHESVLHPDVVVHLPTTPDGRLTEPPVLRVDVAPGHADLRAARRYARFGVDHHWHLDSGQGTLQVSVRLDDSYRRCETFPVESLAPRTTSREPAWVDFGVGLIHLDGRARSGYGHPRAAAAWPAALARTCHRPADSAHER